MREHINLVGQRAGYTSPRPFRVSLSVLVAGLIVIVMVGSFLGGRFTSDRQGPAPEPTSSALSALPKGRATEDDLAKPKVRMASPLAAPTDPEAIPEVTVENGLLTYRGEVIRPGAFEELSTMIADVMPTAVSLDLEGCRDTETYTIDPPDISGDRVRSWEGAGGPVQEAYVEYKYVGQLDCGLHVVQLYECGGGTGVFIHLLLIDFETQPVLFDDDRTRRIVMKCFGQIGLGDRYGGEVKLTGDRIYMPAYDGRTRDTKYPDRVAEIDPAIIRQITTRPKRGGR
ncbi:MAG: hypothetical protein ACYS8X_09130 [Planctomycetota bacterium]|jgi:hypothetical protein